jgi:hypothetical protein
LQTKTGEPLPGCYAIFLTGLADDDALELWRAFGATGARDLLLPLFQRADNHPLLIQALASEVARYRPAPGDFDAWRRDHPDFDPFGLPLVQVKSHVLANTPCVGWTIKRSKCCVQSPRSECPRATTRWPRC